MGRIILSEDQKNKILHNGKRYPTFRITKKEDGTKQSSYSQTTADQLNDLAYETDNFILFTYKNNPHAEKHLSEMAKRIDQILSDVTSTLGITLDNKEKFGIYLYEAQRKKGASGTGGYYGITLTANGKGSSATIDYGVLKHELVHMVELSYIDTYGYFPRWWGEGLACYLSGQRVMETPEEIEELLEQYGDIVNPLKAPFNDGTDLCLYPTYAFAVKYILDPRGGNFPKENLNAFYTRMKELLPNRSMEECFGIAFNEIIAPKIGFSSYKDFENCFYRLDVKGNKVQFNGIYKDYFEKISTPIHNLSKQDEVIVISGHKNHENMKLVLETEVVDGRIYTDLSDLPNGPYIMIFYQEDGPMDYVKAKEVELIDGKIKGSENKIDISDWDSSLYKELPKSLFEEEFDILPSFDNNQQGYLNPFKNFDNPENHSFDYFLEKKANECCSLLSDYYIRKAALDEKNNGVKTTNLKPRDSLLSKDDKALVDMNSS